MDVLRWAVGVEATGCGLVPVVGSGVVARPDGSILTVAHTVAGATDIVIVGADGGRRRGQVTYFDPDRDLAIVQPVEGGGSSRASSAAPMGEPEVPTQGEVATARGDQHHVVPVELTRRLGVTIEDIYLDETSRRTVWEINGSVAHGDSGAGLFVDGRLVGLVYGRARDGDRGFALDERELRAALAATGDGPSAARRAAERCPP